MTKPLVVSMGDPAGIGAEILCKSWVALTQKQQCPALCVIDNYDRLRHIAQQLSLPINIAAINDIVQAKTGQLSVLPLSRPMTSILGQPTSTNADMVIESIERAAQYCLNGQARGMITAPMAKNIVQDAGFAFAGHTEFLAHLSQTPIPLMLLTNKKLSIVPLTIHIALARVAQELTADLIVAKAVLLHHEARRWFPKFQKRPPRIAILGLNPHAGESGKMGREELDIFPQALDECARLGVNLIGPMPADTAFHADGLKKYDFMLGCYHDQALIPVKTIDFHGTVNMTLGLKFMRTSPDHGTAFDIAPQFIANHHSMMNAIMQCDQLTRNL